MSATVEARPAALGELEDAVDEARAEVWVADQVAQLAPGQRLSDELVHQVVERVRAKHRRGALVRLAVGGSR